MFPQSNLILYHTKAFFKTELGCTVISTQRYLNLKYSLGGIHNKDYNLNEEKEEETKKLKSFSRKTKKHNKKKRKSKGPTTLKKHLKTTDHFEFYED